jgi:hypothetical protein
MGLEDFLGGNLLVSAAGIRYRPGESPRCLPRPVSSVLFQPYLLVFLLLYHRRLREVRGIIRELVSRLWNNLTPLDLDRTQKGALRCVTNVHFAANALRSVGLLRFSKQEAYKTWVLSFPGFVAAARLLEKYVPWDIPANAGISGYWCTVVHHDVFDVLKGLHDLAGFVEWLERSFGSVDKERYPTLRSLVGSAHALMVEHGEAFASGSFAQGQRRRGSAALLERFLALPDAERFYGELSDYLMQSTSFRTVRQRWGADDDGPR